jgi:hypothetical protein
MNLDLQILIRRDKILEEAHNPIVVFELQISVTPQQTLRIHDSLSKYFFSMCSS